jgi:hypothetical protein
MTFEQWLQSNGWDSETLTEAQKTSLQAAYDAQNASPPITAAQDMRAEAARLAGIRAICRNHPEIEAEAIEAGWSKADCELAILRAGRTKPPMSSSGRRVEATGNVLEAALCLHLGAADVAERAFDERTVQAARDMRIRHTMDIVEHGLRANHIEPRGGPQEVLRAAWSTNSIAGILSNTGNKILEVAYRQFPSVARQVAKTLTAKDFKSHTGYRLSGDVLLDEVGAAGEIKHGSLSESAFEFRVATFARMLSLTRQDIINDDLTALAEIPRMIGRGAALKLESVFWNLVLSNSGSFFGIGNGNLIDSPLDVAGLSAAVAAMRRQTDSEGEPIAIGPRFLVVPPELESTADELFASVNVVVSGSEDKVRPAGNVFRNKYEPLVTPYLSNASYSGYSTSAWLLFADPADVAAYGIAYLHGVQSPTIESADADFNKLGFQWRGYMDFGCVAIDPKAAVKSTGDAAE